MKNIFRKLWQAVVLGLGLSLLFTGSALAAANSITLTSNLTVNLSGLGINLTILSGSTMAGYTVNTDTLVLNLEDGSNVTVWSADGRNLGNNFSPSASTNCTGSGVTSELILTSAITQTVTITPSDSSRCNTGGGSTYSSPGGGGSAPSTPSPTASFTSNFSTITLGQSATLTWSTTNATTVSINQGIGTVAASGTKVVTPTSTTSYILTATGSGGTVTQTVTVAMGSAPVSVTPPAGLLAQSGAHAPGSVVSTTGGTVWFITQDNTRRAFTSGGAFLSYGYLSFSQVVAANAADLALAQGAFIPPMDGKIVCSDRNDSYAVKGTCYLITAGKRAAFTSGKVFTALGFKFTHTTTGDVSFLPTDANISDSVSAHRPGVLVNNNGTVQLVGASSLMGIPSMSVLTSWGYGLADVVSANAADKAITQSGVMPTRVAGQLSP